MNNLRKTLLVSAGLSTAVFGGWWSHIFSGHTGPDIFDSTVSKDSEQTPVIPETAEKIDQHARLPEADRVLEELSRLKARLANIEDSGNSHATMVVDKDISEGIGALDDEIDGLTGQGIQAEQEMVEDTALHFADQFGQESQDPSWSSETERVITKLLDGDDFQELQVVSTECQTSMCRVELSVDGNSSPSEVVHELLMALPFDTQSFFHNSDIENDTEHTVVYLAREDYELPRMVR